MSLERRGWPDVGWPGRRSIERGDQPAVTGDLKTKVGAFSTDNVQPTNVDLPWSNACSEAEQVVPGDLGSCRGSRPMTIRGEADAGLVNADRTGHSHPPSPGCYRGETG